VSATRDVGRTSSDAPQVRSTVRNAETPASLRRAGVNEDAPLEPAEEVGAEGAPAGGAEGDSSTSAAGSFTSDAATDTVGGRSDPADRITGWCDADVEK